MKNGIVTTEFWVHIGVLLAAWTTTALTMLDQFKGVIPEKDNQYVLLVTLLLSAVQSAAYSLSRGRVKTQALKTQEAEATLASQRLAASKPAA